MIASEIKNIRGGKFRLLCLESDAVWNIRQDVFRYGMAALPNVLLRNTAIWSRGTLLEGQYAVDVQPLVTSSVLSTSIQYLAKLAEVSLKVKAGVPGS